MNSPESITVDLTHAKALKEAGWPQDVVTSSEHIHGFYYNGDYLNHRIGQFEAFVQHGDSGRIDAPIEDRYAAPSAEEILRTLPKKCPSHGGNLIISNAFTDGHWFVGFGNYFDCCGCHLDSGTLANAAADMWIYLKKNNLLPSSL